MNTKSFLRQFRPLIQNSDFEDTTPYLLPEHPISLPQVMRMHVTRESELDLLDKGQVEPIIKKYWHFRPILKFVWNPKSVLQWKAGLRLLDLGGEYRYLWSHSQTDRSLLVAAIRDKNIKIGLNALIGEMFDDNGERFGIQLFPELPDLIRNLAPELITAATIKMGIYRWLEFSGASSTSDWEIVICQDKALFLDKGLLDQANSYIKNNYSENNALKRTRGGKHLVRRQL